MKELQALLDSLNEELDYFQREKDEFDHSDNPSLHSYIVGKMAGMTKAVLILEQHIKVKKTRNRVIAGFGE